MKIIYALYQSRNGGKYVHSNEDFFKKSSLQALMCSQEVLTRVAICFAICFEYSARPVYLKISIQKFIKPVV